MKNPVLKNGIIAGVINAIFLLTFGILGSNHTINNAEYLGFIGMFLSFIYLFIGVYQKRKLTQNEWKFSNAFGAGITIALIASLFYVFTWMFVYYNMIPDFADRYADKVIEQLRAKGLPQADLDKQIADMALFRENYKNPLYNAGMTFSEIFPIGFLLSLIAAAIFRKKTIKTAV